MPNQKAEEIADGGYVKIYRSTMRKSWYKKSEAVHLWVHLIMLATHSEREYLWNGTTIILKPGQFITGRKKLSSETGISEGKIRKFLELFKTDQQISQQISNTSSLISILNYEKYHSNDQQNNQQPTNEQPTGNQQPTTKQELKELEELKEGRIAPTKFIKPKKEEVSGFLFNDKNIDEFTAMGFADRFVNYYESNGWKVGKNPMKNWKAAVNTWLSKDHIAASPNLNGIGTDEHTSKITAAL